MSETVRVRGTRFPKGHRLYPQHTSQPGGPLIQIPKAPPQTFVGWHRVKIDRPDPVNELGDTRMKNDFTYDSGEIRHERKPVMYRWELDSSPVVVRRTREINLAIERGDIEVVKKSKGGDK